MSEVNNQPSVYHQPSSTFLIHVLLKVSVKGLGLTQPFVTRHRMMSEEHDTRKVVDGGLFTIPDEIKLAFCNHFFRISVVRKPNSFIVIFIDYIVSMTCISSTKIENA